MTTYYITSSSDDYWNETTAKTLHGAKIIATETYQPSVGGKISIAVKHDYYYETIAVKHGYDNWQNA